MDHLRSLLADKEMVGRKYVQERIGIPRWASTSRS